MTLARRTPKTGASASPDLAHAKPAPRSVRERVKTLARRLTGREPAPKPPTPQQRRSRVKEGLILLAKTAAKVRDFFRCQFPGCTVSGRHNVEAAHLEDAGMGGRFSVSNHQRCYVTLCRAHHQGRRSVHTTHIEVRPLTADGGDGPLAWYDRTRHGNTWSAWRHVGISGRPLLSQPPRS